MKKFALILLLLLSAPIIIAQKYNKANLQSQNKKIRDEISKLNNELTRVKKESETSVLYFTQLTQKIESRSKLINNTAKEKHFIEDEIYLKQLEINKLNRELSELRKQYSEVLIKSYKNKSVQNKMLFIFTSKDLGQALRRLKYLEKYGDYQEKQSNEISSKQTNIIQSIQQKEKSKKEKESLLLQQQKEMKILDVEKGQKEKIVLKYKNDENGLMTKLREKQKVSANLERDISNAINEEIAILKAKREAEAKKRKEAELKRKKEAEELAKKEAETRKKEAEARKKEEEKRLAEIRKAEKERIEKERTERERLEKERLEKIRKIASEEERKKAETLEKERAEKDKIVREKFEKDRADKLERERLERIKADEARNAKVYESPKIVEKRDELEVISDKFTENQRRLPWPVDGGTVVSRFGNQPHPVIPNITMNNAGIEIATRKGAVSRAVFQGEVFKIQSIPGGNKAVMVNHGDYFTIYTNLQEVYVKQGDKISARQNIGKIYTDDSGNTLCGFQIWKGTTKVNPANWLTNM